MTRSGSDGLTLAQKLFLFGTILSVGSVAVSGGFQYARAKGMIFAELGERGHLLASSLAANARKGVETENLFRTLEPLIEATLAQKDVVFVSIADSSGRVLGQGGGHRAHSGLLEVVEPILSASDGLSLEAQPEHPDGKAKVGEVRLRLSLDAYRDSMRRILIGTILLMAAILGAVVVAASVVGSRLVRPIGALVEASRRIGRGEYGVSVPESSGGEFGELAKSFNEMSRDLSKAKGYLEEILETMLDALIIVGADGKILMLNRAALEMLGFRSDDLVGHPVSKLFIDDERSPFKGEAMERLLRDGAVREQFVTFRSEAGEGLPVRFSASLLKDKDGRAFAIMAIAQLIIDERGRLA